MTPFKKGVVIVLAAAAGLAVLAGGYGLQRQLIGGARAHLQARDPYKIDIFGMRIPCHGLFDIGVAAVIRKSEHGEADAGRLCRPFDASSEWQWYSNQGGPSAAK